MRRGLAEAGHPRVRHRVKTVSTDCDFRLFCRSVLRQEPMAIVDAAGAEAARTHRVHRERTGRAIRRGSKPWRYCQHLYCLTRMLTMCEYPANAEEDFFDATAPLVTGLLPRWQLGSLREVFSPENVAKRDAEAALTDSCLAAILEAQAAGKAAAEAVHDAWRERLGEREQYGFLACAVLHLTIRPRSLVAKRLFDLAERRPHLLRVDRDFGASGIVITIADMVRGLEQEMHICGRRSRACRPCEQARRDRVRHVPGKLSRSEDETWPSEHSPTP